MPVLTAPSADLLGSPVSRGALSQIGKRKPLLRLRAPTCLGLPTHGALSQFGFFHRSCLGLLFWGKSHTECKYAMYAGICGRVRYPLGFVVPFKCVL